MRQDQITQGKGKICSGELIDIALPDTVSKDLSYKDKPGTIYIVVDKISFWFLVMLKLKSFVFNTVVLDMLFMCKNPKKQIFSIEPIGLI